MDKEFFSYEKWVEEALRDVIKRALKQTARDGLFGDHHFFITFLTSRSDVDIPKHLRAEHPEEMTIVLQHQFHNLEVSENGFSVNLSFSGRSCYLAIPFSAITAFADPAVNFVLQLKMTQLNDTHDNTHDNVAEIQNDRPKRVSVDGLAMVKDKQPQPAPLEAEQGEKDGNSPPVPEEEKMGEVIALDTFRKK